MVKNCIGPVSHLSVLSSLSIILSVEIRHTICLEINDTMKAFRSFHGFNFGISSHSSDAQEAEDSQLFELISFLDDFDPARNSVFNTLRIPIDGVHGTNFITVVRFQSHVLGLCEGRVAFYPDEHYKSAPRCLVFQILNDVIGIDTFSLKTSEGDQRLGVVLWSLYVGLLFAFFCRTFLELSQRGKVVCVLHRMLPFALPWCRAISKSKQATRLP